MFNVDITNARAWWLLAKAVVLIYRVWKHNRVNPQVQKEDTTARHREKKKNSSITEAFQLSEAMLWMKTWLCGTPQHSSHTQTWPTWFRAGTRQGETDSRMHRDRQRSMQPRWKDSQGHEPLWDISKEIKRERDADRIRVSKAICHWLYHVDGSCIIIITHTYSTHILYMNHGTQSDQTDTEQEDCCLVFSILLCLRYLHRPISLAQVPHHQQQTHIIRDILLNYH